MFPGGYAMSDQLLESVRAKYGAVAESTLSTEHAGVKAVAEAFGYTAEELTSIPAGANMGLSCGNPTATAHLRAGEVVVDLGSGGGLDVFLASKMVGPAGRLHECRVLPRHHRTDSAPRCFRRLRHFELRRESGTGQARCLPRDRAR